ncbi:hypothetical protein LCGC14_1312480 [marine sediment metagenome]|uniref:Uncharacterized protein n=1 Tax=marine sediment metagenome TaxID=412755 RepID=A0A0F9N2U6_9ZZZZ
MGIWSDNPEWFDEWLEQRALGGQFGKELQQQAETGDFVAYEQWGVLDVDGSLGSQAMDDYCTRSV